MQSGKEKSLNIWHVIHSPSLRTDIQVACRVRVKYFRQDNKCHGRNRRKKEEVKEMIKGCEAVWWYQIPPQRWNVQRTLCVRVSGRTPGCKRQREYPCLRYLTWRESRIFFGHSRTSFLTNFSEWQFDIVLVGGYRYVHTIYSIILKVCQSVISGLATDNADQHAWQQHHVSDEGLQGKVCVQNTRDGGGWLPGGRSLEDL